MKSRPRRHRRAASCERQDMAMEVLALAGVADQLAQDVGVRVFREEVIRAELDCRDRAVNVRRLRRS